MIDWVHDMLVGWGYWARSQRDGNLGYAPTYPAYREYQPPTGHVYSGVPNGMRATEYDALTKIIDGLPMEESRQTRRVIVMRYADGMSAMAIAGVINKSRQTVHNMINEAHVEIARGFGPTNGG